jgi:hypothetical protein
VRLARKRWANGFRVAERRHHHDPLATPEGSVWLMWLGAVDM